MPKDRLQKILFIIPSLAGGGAERVCVNILKYINRKEFTPYLVLFEKKGEYLNLVPRDVIIYNLNKKCRFDFFKLILLLAFRVYPKMRPDIVVSFLEYASLIAVMAKKLSLQKPAVIITEHTYRTMNQRYQRMSAFKNLLVRMFYPHANKIITVSKGIKEDLNINVGIPNKKMEVVHNGVDLSTINRLIREPVDDTSWFEENVLIIVACGRLKGLKNYPLLIKAFEKIQKNNRARLLVIGEGEERNSLNRLVYKLGIQDKVAFLGFQKNPFKFMARATVFVLSSDWEGFGNVIIEAMACGVPVVSTRCPSGPGEIIKDGVNGLLVPVGGEESLAKAIIKLLRNPGLRNRFSEAGRERAKAFSLDKIILEYEKILHSIIE